MIVLPFVILPFVILPFVLEPPKSLVLYICTYCNILRFKIILLFRHYHEGGSLYSGCELHGCTDHHLPDHAEKEKELSPPAYSPPDSPDSRSPQRPATPPYDHSGCSALMHKSCICVNFIAEHTRAKEEATKVYISS